MPRRCGRRGVVRQPFGYRPSIPAKYDQQGGPIKSRNRAPRLADTADKYSLYERSVQCVEAEIDFVDATYRALRGRNARVLREDFCGTANTSCEWVRRRRTNRAIGVDLDPEPLAWCRDRHWPELTPSARRRIELRQTDVRTIRGESPDIVLAMNFSYYIFKERATLLRYFRSVRRSLADGGVFFLDGYGGYDAFRVLEEATAHEDFTYVWEQASYNAVTGDMQCYIHFRFPDRSKLERAFSYHWRMWTLREVLELLAEAGFSRVTTYFQGWDDASGEADGIWTAGDRVDADAGWLVHISAEK